MVASSGATTDGPPTERPYAAARCSHSFLPLRSDASRLSLANAATTFAQKTPFVLCFPMFVPSPSWQNHCFQYISGSKKASSAPAKRTDRPAQASRKRAFFEFSPCLSRACLGKMIVFIHKWLKNAVFCRDCCPCGHCGRLLSMKR